MGIVIDPAPVTGLAANFSPRPRIAPPPLGSDSEGGLIRNESAGAAPSLPAAPTSGPASRAPALPPSADRIAPPVPRAPQASYALLAQYVKSQIDPRRLSQAKP